MTIARERLAALARSAQRPQPIAFGAWQPDLFPHGSPGVTTATGCLARRDGYAPWPQAVAVSDALPAAGRGTFVGQNTATKTNKVFAGTATELYELVASSWSAVGGAAGYSLGPEHRWSGVQFDDRVIMVAKSENPQSWVMGTSSAFSDLVGSPPKAAYVAVVREFVVLGNLNDGVERANRVQWCAIGDPTDWTPAAATQADFQDLRQGGAIRGVVSGAEYGSIISEFAIHRMDYVGSPSVFSFDKIEHARGTPAAGSIATVGRNTFYLGEDGFYAYDGTAVTPIGHEHVDRTVLADMDESKLAFVTSTIDPRAKFYFFAYTSSEAGSPQKVLAYNYAENKWSVAAVANQGMILFENPTYTLDTLDAFSTSIDAITIPLDSSFWTTRLRSAGLFDDSNRVALFTGAPMEATIETGDTPSSQRTRVTGARPLTDAVAPNVAVASREALGDSPVFGTAIPPALDGVCPVLGDGRYHRYRFHVPAGHMWTRAQGLQVHTAPSGYR